MQLSSTPDPASNPASGRWQLVAQFQELKTARWIWCLIAVLVVGIRHLASDGAQPLGPKFGDTDDALRLMQVRDFLMYGNWYDTRLATIGAPEALNSHWSRLIDLPVAWLISVFALFATYLNAELAAQIVWPLLLLFAVARFMVSEAERRAGPDFGIFAAIVLLALLLLSPSGLFQFLPGRIDHHNAQIVCAVIGTLLLQRAMTDPSAGWWAGAIMALGLIIGFEALPLLAATLGLACLLACFDKTARMGASRAVMTLGVGLVVGYAVTTHPVEWLNAQCDELGLNLIALTGSGAVAAVVLSSRFRDASHWVWIGGFGVAGFVGLGLYFAANPVCAGGAFVGMDPIVKTQWLSGVVEGKTLWQFAKIQPSMAFGFLVIMGMALAIVIREAWQSRTTSHIFIAASLLLAGLYGFYYIKFMPYGALLSLVPMACWIAALPARGETTAQQMRLRAVIVCNQTLFVMLAGIVIGLFSNVESGAKAKMSSSVTACTLRSDIAKLASLKRGLVISDIDLGPYVAVSTRHRAYTGPYHRLHVSLRDLIVLLRAPLAEAGDQLSKMNADYLVLCGVGTGANAAVKPKAGSFSEHMRAGGTFKGLEPVSVGKTEGPLRVWKIVKPD